MSSNFDRLYRGKVYCDCQKANSQIYDDNWDNITWSGNTILEEVKERGNHSGSVVKHFKVKET